MYLTCMYVYIHTEYSVMAKLKRLAPATTEYTNAERVTLASEVPIEPLLEELSLGRLSDLNNPYP